MTPRRAPVLFPELWIQSWKRLFQDYGRGDGKGRALARRRMARATETAYFSDPNSEIGSVQSIIMCRNAGLRVHRAAACRYCHAHRRSCARSSYRRPSACISSAARHRTSTRTAIEPSAPIPDRIVRELRHQANLRMPEAKRGETRTLRDSHHTMDLMSMSDHAWLAQKMANHESFDEALKEHELPRDEIDLPTAPASNLSTPSTVSERDAS